MKSITENFAEFISNKSCLVKFGAEWCGPCRVVKPVLEAVENDTGVEVFDVDIEENSDAAISYGIRNIPAVIAFKNGQPVEQLVGAFGKDAYLQLVDKVKE